MFSSWGGLCEHSDRRSEHWLYMHKLRPPFSPPSSPPPPTFLTRECLPPPLPLAPTRTWMMLAGPPTARAMGMQPADMPSTIEMPKCSRLAGSDSGSMSAPVRCHCHERGDQGLSEAGLRWPQVFHTVHPFPICISAACRQPRNTTSVSTDSPPVHTSRSHIPSTPALLPRAGSPAPSWRAPRPRYQLPGHGDGERGEEGAKQRSE